MAHRLRPLVRQQLFEIFDYTAGTFGEKQAETYLNELFGVFGMLCANPRVGRAYHAGTWQFIHGRHIIICELDQDDIIVVRIFHAAQRR